VRVDMSKYRVRQDAWGDWLIEKRVYLFFWNLVRDVGKDENRAIEIIALMKKEPIYF